MKRILGKSRKRIITTVMTAVLMAGVMACGGGKDSAAVSGTDSGAGQEEKNQSGENELEQVTIDIFMDSASENP